MKNQKAYSEESREVNYISSKHFPEKLYEGISDEMWIHLGIMGISLKAVS